MRSIRGELLKWVLGALCLGSIVLVLVAYLVSLAEMNEVLDENLRDVASSLAEYRERAPAVAVAPSAEGHPMDDAHDYGDLVTQISRPDGSLLFSSNAQVALPLHREAGERTESIAGTEWRTYTLPGPQAIVQVAQRTVARKEMAGEAALRLVVPLALLTLLIGGLLVFGLRRGLEPLDDAAAQMSERTATSLAPLAERELPREMRPLVAAFNGLMGRLEASFTLQRNFVADAAHELRTPVAALGLQLQLLERARDEAGRAEAIRELRGGMDRTARLVEQLLQLSRAQPDVEVFEPVPVALDELARSVVGDFSRLAERVGVDLGVSSATAVTAHADPDQLRVLLNNLVRNAVQFAPAGSRVDVSAGLEDGRPWLAVADQGPGIPAAERGRVFDRFYRSADTAASAGGSGLGLAIVKAIADRHGARVSLGDGLDGGGLQVRVVLAPPPAA
ncbi:two-component sensor histidine kinase [Xylophilus rhododendri]|uniref:histidine kinase n=1 Tax=Xylophilus rhododendri TaxID=2697032 RepID=A0A857JBL8_9BURK|nr:ATP-binding protein [Xylophilus rhododendri]QHJ00353.1 two-component sensor histidine kinase [Xylophilus rhododendri]